MEPFTAKCKQSVSIRSVQSQYVNIECVIKPHMSWVYSNVNETQIQGSLTFITSGAHEVSSGLRSYLRSWSLWRQLVLTPLIQRNVFSYTLSILCFLFVPLVLLYHSLFVTSLPLPCIWHSLFIPSLRQWCVKRCVGHWRNHTSGKWRLL